MTDPNAKILFRVVDSEGNVDVESLWAESLGNDMYRLDNSPFYAYGVSWKDVVFAPVSEEEEFPIFQKVIDASGHKTIRVIFDPPAVEGSRNREILNESVALGGSFEGANPGYLAIDIPPDVDFWAICNHFTNNDIQWEHANPTYDDIYTQND